MSIYESIFKKLVSFDIGKVWPIWIRCQNLCDFRQFFAILGDFWEIAENRVHFSLQMLLSDLVKIVGPYEFWRILTFLTLLISKMSDFLKIDAYMAILWPKENWTVFFLYFFGITQVKVENQLIFVKLLKNPQFLTKIHKVGLVWLATLISTDRISKNNKFQYFIVVRVEKYVSWARRRQPLLFPEFGQKVWVFN